MSNLSAFVFFAFAAIAVGTILQAFLIAAHSFTQTQTALLLGAVIVLIICFSMGASCLIPHYGAKRVLQFGITSALIGSYCLISTPYTVCCLRESMCDIRMCVQIATIFVAGVFIACSIVSIPAFQTIFTLQVEEKEQGQLQGST